MTTSVETVRRSPLIAAAEGVETAIALFCKGLVLLTGSALLVAITTGVVSRYVITVGGADWAEELPKQIFAWFIMSGVVLAVHGGNHIAVDLIHMALPERFKTILMVATNVLVAGAYFYLATIAWEVAGITSFEINPILGTPGSVPYWALAGGSVLTGIGCLAIAVKVAALGSSAAPQARPEDSVQ